MRLYLNRRANHIRLNYGGIFKVSKLVPNQEVVMAIEGVTQFGIQHDTLEMFKFETEMYENLSVMTVKDIRDGMLEQVDFMSKLSWCPLRIKKIYGLNCLIMVINPGLIEGIQELGYAYVSFSGVLLKKIKYEGRTSILDRNNVDVKKLIQVLVNDKTSFIKNFDYGKTREDFLTKIVQCVHMNINTAKELLDKKNILVEGSADVLKIIKDLSSEYISHPKQYPYSLTANYLKMFDAIPVEFLTVLGLLKDVDENTRYMLSKLFSYGELQC